MPAYATGHQPVPDVLRDLIDSTLPTHGAIGAPGTIPPANTTFPDIFADYAGLPDFARRLRGEPRQPAPVPASAAPIRAQPTQQVLQEMEQHGGGAADGDTGEVADRDANSAFGNLSAGRNAAVSLASKFAPGIAGLAMGAMNVGAGFGAQRTNEEIAGLERSFAETLADSLGIGGFSLGNTSGGVGGYGSPGAGGYTGAMDYTDPGVAGPARAQARSALDRFVGYAGFSPPEVASFGYGFEDVASPEDARGMAFDSFDDWSAHVGEHGAGWGPTGGADTSPDPGAAGRGDIGSWDDIANDAGQGTGQGQSSSQEAMDDLGLSEGDADAGEADSVICNELYRMGLMPRHIWRADQEFAGRVPADVVAGYHWWAKPAVRWMRRSHFAVCLALFFAMPWAFHMAYRMGVTRRDNLFGRLIMTVGWPVCRAIGRMRSHAPALAEGV